MNVLAEKKDQLTERLQTLAETRGRIKAALQEQRVAFELLLSESSEMSEETFWPLVEEFNQTRKNYKSRGMKSVIDMFAHRLAFPRSYVKVAPQTSEEVILQAISFLCTYQKKVGALYRPLFDVIQGYSDDGYGDLLDSFPLHGKERYKLALQGEIVGSSEDQYQGENYIQMHLGESLQEYIACQADLIFQSGDE